MQSNFIKEVLSQGSLLCNKNEKKNLQQEGQE